MNRVERISQTIHDMASRLGAFSSGIVRKEDLAGGPPSADLTYVLPKAKTAFVFALAMDPKKIEAFLQKKDHAAHDQDNVRTNVLASGISLEISNYLKMKGYNSVPLGSNLEYRTDTKNGVLDEAPPISHRYLAVRSGIGWFGRSGNIIAPEHGSGIILGSLVTEAELTPTEPLPEKDNYCDDCKLCHAACASGFLNPNETTQVSLGGQTFSYSKKNHHTRCDYVCGGFTGLHPSKKWSTWSPGRFPIPEKDEDFMHAMINSAQAYKSRPRLKGGFYHFLIPGNHVSLTCCHCALICVPDREERNRRFKMIKNSGVVIQLDDGSLKAVSPEKAEIHLSNMTPEVRALYE